MTKVWRDFISCHPKPLFNSPCLEVGCWQNIYDTVAGWNPAPVGMVNFPLFTGVLYIPGGAGFLPSTVSPQFMIVLSKLETTTIFCWFLSCNLWNAWNVFRSMLIHLLDDHGFLGSLGSSNAAWCLWFSWQFFVRSMEHSEFWGCFNQKNDIILYVRMLRLIKYIEPILSDG